MRAIIYWCLSFFLYVFFLVAPAAIFAQTSDIKIESCFKYYNYGKIKTQFSTQGEAYKPGDVAKFSGSIVNNNSFPLVDVILYAHVRRLNTSTSEDNGHYLIDKATLLEHLNFLPNETKRLDFKLPIKKTYPEGKYIIQYYIFSKQAFHYGGRSFLEEDNAGITNFSISSNTKPDLYFDIDTLQVNSAHHKIREQIFEFPEGPVQLSVNLIDNRSEKTSLPVKIKVYSFEDTDGNKLISETTSEYKPPQKSVLFTFNPPSAGAYVVLLEINSPIQSMFKYRFATNGEAPGDLRMNDVGVSDFPATRQSRAWVCFHSPTPKKSATTTVKLSVLNASEKAVESSSTTQSFDGDVHAISIPLSKLSTPNDFWVEAIFVQNGKSRAVRTHYDCKLFDNSVKEVKLSYDDSQSDRILIETKNSCGQNVNDGTVLDGIRIKQGEKVVTSTPNFSASSGYYSIGKLPSGTYIAEAKYGKLLPKVSFTVSSGVSISQTNPKQQSNRKLIALVIIIIAFLIIGIVTFYINKKKVL